MMPMGQGSEVPAESHRVVIEIDEEVMGSTPEATFERSVGREREGREPKRFGTFLAEDVFRSVQGDSDPVGGGGFKGCDGCNAR